MSRGASNASGLGPLGRSLALGAPAVTALTLAAIVGLPPTEPDHELQLVAPEHVPSGAIVPLRAHLYAGLKQPQGPALGIAPTRVELRGPDSSPWASTALRAGFGSTMEGALRVPAGRHGRATLVASASHQGVRLSVERSLQIDPPGARPDPISPQERELPALRSLATSPVRGADELAFDPRELRVRGEACVPEAACELVVHVGPLPIAVLAEPSPSVSVAEPPSPSRPSPSAPSPSTAADGVVSLLVTPHGPEAELTLRAERNGVPLSRWGVRLPLALGGSASAAMPDVLRAPEPLRAALQGSDRGCIVDAFVDGRWARTGSLRDCRSPEPVPFAALEPGIWRVQLRRDRFDSGSAAVRSVYVARRDESAASITQQLARAALVLEPNNGIARSIAGVDAPPVATLVAPPGASVATAGNNSYLLAVLEHGIVPLPVPSSGHAAAVLRMHAARGQLRKLGLLALGACALTLVALLGQRGYGAAHEASRLLTAAGTDPGVVRRARMRMALRLLATLCALLLAFAAIAAYVVARAASL
ncbi:MAG TPA: hypothetical protein VK509_11440 [Polyangiales bacterium]|nr:hypothetical protein [Polyangiales bacterium]